MPKEYQFAWQQGKANSDIAFCVLFNSFDYQESKAHLSMNFSLPSTYFTEFAEFIMDIHEQCLSVFCSSHRQHFELKTQRHGELFSLMHHFVLGDDPEVKQGKPSPDIFLAAAKRFEVKLFHRCSSIL